MGYRQDVAWAQRTGRMAREMEKREQPVVNDVIAAMGRGVTPRQAKAGDRVRLIRTTDPYTRLRPGAEGTVSLVDAMGTVHVAWDEGSNLGLVPGEDQWKVL